MTASAPNSDSPTCHDKLDWARPLVHISDRIEHCEAPHVLGIHGDWGSGKTSFMRQVQWTLGGKPPKDGSVAAIDGRDPPNAKDLRNKIITIWFDAWRYQNEPAPVVALLQEMRQQMATMSVVKAKLAKLSTIAAYAAFDGFSELGKIIGLEGVPGMGSIEQRGEKWEKDNYADGLVTNSIREHLQNTIKRLLPNGPHARVVIFIDDLDRCNPKAAMRLLEGLKIYMSIPQCVFVLGMNERILVDAIGEEISAPKDATEEELKLRASHYLEKICTDIYRLPLPASPVQLLRHWIINPDQYNALKAAIGDNICLPPNPRRLKALANQWPLFAACVPFPHAGDPDAQMAWAARVLIAAYIHQFNRELWERWHFSANFWGEIEGWCNKMLVAAPLPGANIPKWAAALKLPHQIKEDSSTAGTVTSERLHHNPGDIDIFWIGSLIFAHKDKLTANDFAPLLLKHQQS
jgi:ABC-type dipeptide/oligopeptide/nickel transport system ATPase subunit